MYCTTRDQKLQWGPLKKQLTTQALHVANIGIRNCSGAHSKNNLPNRRYCSQHCPGHTRDQILHRDSLKIPVLRIQIKLDPDQVGSRTFPWIWVRIRNKLKRREIKMWFIFFKIKRFFIGFLTHLFQLHYWDLGLAGTLITLSRTFIVAWCSMQPSLHSSWELYLLSWPSHRRGALNWQCHEIV